ncbi:MAG: hypothetical protein ACKVP4_09085 [Hyphomicrobium sp.]
MVDAYSDDDGGGAFARLRRLFGSTFDILIGLLSLAYVVGVFGFIIKDAASGFSKDRTGLRTITASRWNDRTLAFSIDGADRNGRAAKFDVVVLTKMYGWVRGSTTELERGETRLSPDDISREVFTQQLREGLGSARELIAVGLASQEGEVERETQRAGLRAARIAEWVREAVGRSIPIWTLNLGRYVEVCADCETEDTSWQRPFIVVAVRVADPGTDIGEALAVALSDKSNLPSPSRYSTFALSKFTK